MSAQTDQLVAAVTNMKSVDDGVLATFASYKQRLEDALALSDPAATQAIQGVINDLDTEAQRITDAITANTPVV